MFQRKDKITTIGCIIIKYLGLLFALTFPFPPKKRTNAFLNCTVLPDCIRINLLG